jgi:hypothetical protein
MADNANTPLTDAEHIARLEAALVELLMANPFLSKKKWMASPNLKSLVEEKTGTVIDLQMM